MDQITSKPSWVHLSQNPPVTYAIRRRRISKTAINLMTNLTRGTVFAG